LTSLGENSTARKRLAELRFVKVQVKKWGYFFYLAFHSTPFQEEGYSSILGVLNYPKMPQPEIYRIISCIWIVRKA
jgi:hypothetical protein